MASSYVAPGPGGFVVVVNGVNQGSYPTQQEAEQAYNTVTGQSNAPAAPSGGAPGAISDAHRSALQAAGYADWANPNLTEADYARIATGAETAGGVAPYGSSVNLPAADLAEQQVRDAAQAAYWKALTDGASDRLAFDKATQAAQQALDTLKFAASLSGPANAFEYAKALNGTPNGMADIVSAANGTYRLPATGGGNGQPIVPLSISSILGDIAKYSPPPATTNGSTTGGSAGTYQTVNGTKTVAQMLAELDTAAGGHWGGDRSDAGVVAGYAGTTKGAVTANGVAPTTVSQQTNYVPATVAASAAPQVSSQAQTASVPSGVAPYVAPAAAPVSAATPAPVTTPTTVSPSPVATPPHTAILAAHQQTLAALTNGSAYKAPSTDQNGTWQANPSGGGLGSTWQQAKQSSSDLSGATTTPTPTPPANATISYVPAFGPLPLPNQISPTNYAAMAPSQRDLLLGAYANQGWEKNDVLAAMSAATKGYSGPSGSPQSASIGF